MSTTISAQPSPSLFSLRADNLTPVVIALLLLHLVLWTFFTGISHRSPDLDNIESLVWASGLEWGYYKHPPLPTWIQYVLVQVFGRSGWLTFFTGQLSVVLALWMLWKLGCEFTTQYRALIATLLVSLVAYFTVRGVINNHNTMQLWSVAGAIWMLYRASHRDSFFAWAALGFFSACAFLTKYSALVQFAAFFLYLLGAGHLKRAATWKGMVVATAVLLAMVTPHLLWLVQQASGPVAYVNRKMVSLVSYWDAIKDLSRFLSTSFGRIAVMVLALLIILAWVARTWKKSGAHRKPPRMVTALARTDRCFILCVGLGPLLLTIIGFGAMKIPLEAHWGTTFFLLFGFFSFWLLPSGDDAALLRKTVIVVVLFQAISAAAYGLARGPLADHAGRPSRATFPGAQVSAQIHAQWQQHTSRPLTVVAAETWVGGNIAMYIGREVQVLIEGDYAKSPWVDSAYAAQCGILVAINRSPNYPYGAGQALTAFMAQTTVRGTLQMPWTRKQDGPMVIIEWGIIPPRDSCPALAR